MKAKGYQISIRADGDLGVRVDKIAKRLGVNRSMIVRYALDTMLPDIESNGLVIKPQSCLAGGKAIPVGGRAA